MLELDWRNRVIAGERAEDLARCVFVLGGNSTADALDALEVADAGHHMPLHRALLRVRAERLLRQAASLRPCDAGWEDPDGERYLAFVELISRIGLCFRASSVQGMS
jgi:hypothetical protein